jgi:pimeloyl-ACP methyl ester carboxylesterase
LRPKLTACPFKVFDRVIWLALLFLMVLGVAHTLISKRRIEQFWPMQGRLVMAGGVPAHLVERGDGHEVLLLHGAASNARELMAAMEGRLDGCRLIAPDRPGLGYSGIPKDAWQLKVQAAFVADILSQSATGPVVCVGHSWGSGVLLRLALDRPELVKALVLLAPASHPWVKKPNLVNRLCAVPLLGDLLIWTLPALLGPRLMQAGIARGFAPGPVVPHDYGAIIGTPLFFRPHSFKANAADMEAGSREMGLQAHRYKDITIPVSIVSGQGDVIVFNSIHAAGLARDIPHAQSFRVKGAGHMPHWVDGDLVGQIILAHAKDAPMPPTSAQFHAEP